MDSWGFTVGANGLVRAPRFAGKALLVGPAAIPRTNLATDGQPYGEDRRTTR
jgi:hypothetical protein